MVGRAEPLVVDPAAHAEELRRFESHVVRGPGGDDCAIWVGAIDGYGRNRTVYTPTLSDRCRMRNLDER